MKSIYIHFLRSVKIIFVLLFFSTTIFSQSNFSIEIAKVNPMYYQPPYTLGLFTVTYTPGAQGMYLSIGAQGVSTGPFVIIISNLYLPSTTETNSPTTLSREFNLDDLAISPGMFPSQFTCYVHILTLPGFYPFPPSTWVDTKTVTLTTIIDDAFNRILQPDPPIVITTASPPGLTVGDPKIKYEYRKDIPNIDLNSSTNGISATYAGDLNACVPAATSNSMKWLESKYNDIKLPADMTHRKTLEELSKLMKRPNGEGTTDNDMIQGKLDFAEKYNLPMEVKFQSTDIINPIGIGSTSGKSIARSFNKKDNTGTLKPPSWDFLLEQMKNGEDVEINYTWKNATDNKWYAHSICVTGITEHQNGHKEMSYKHDRTQEAARGTLEECPVITIDADGWIRFGPGNKNFVKTIVAESPIIPFGRETAAWLNELVVNPTNNNNVVGKVNGTTGVSEFIEVALNQSATDLQNYKVTLYNGVTGTVYATYTLNQFTAGSTSNGLKFYSYSFPNGELLAPPAGILISYSGSPILGQFWSYGGTFTPTEGDGTSMTSTNMGDVVAGQGFSLAGGGTNYAGYSWEYSSSFTKGALNPGEVYSNLVPAIPKSTSPADGTKNLPTSTTLSWNAVTNAVLYDLQVSDDITFITTLSVQNGLASTSKDITGLDAGKKIYWRVRANNATGSSGFSSKYFFSTILQTPTTLTATSSSSKNKLTWIDNSANETGFAIERKNGDANSTNAFAAVETVPANTVTYTDQNVTAGSTYTYRIRAVNNNSESNYSNTATVSTITGVEKNKQIPTEFKLDQNYPNPFNPTTIISYSIPENSFVQLKIYDLLGNVITTLVSENQSAGIYKITFDGSNLTSGIYFYQLITPKYTSTKKLMLVK